MAVIIILACIALFTLLVLSSKVKITFEYKDEFSLFVGVGLIRIKVFPIKKRKKRGPHSMSRARAAKIREKARKRALKKRQKKLEKKREKQQEQEKTKARTSFEGVLDAISAIKEIVTTTLGKFFGHLHVDLARFHITVATGDAATTAIIYGSICSALAHLFHILEPLRGFDLPKNRDVSVYADYLAEKTTADIKLTFSLRIWHGLHIALATLIKVIKHALKLKAKNETLPDGHNNKTA